MKLRQKLLLLAPICMTLSFAAIYLATPAKATSTEIVDALGRKVTVNTPVERVVVTFNYEEFTAIAGVDGWKKVVAISREPWAGWRPAIFSRYTKVIPNLENMPDVGHLEDDTFSAEKVIAARPDVLFMAEWGYNGAKVKVQQIEAAGIPVIVIDYNAQEVSRHVASTRALGKIMGQEARAEELASLYQREFRLIMDRIAKLPTGPKKKVYVELGQAGPETFGNTYNNTMWGKVITQLGAENLATGRIPGAWGPLNAETVIAENPDAIFIAGSSWLNRPKAVKTGYDATPDATRASLGTYAARPGWSDLKAVKTGNFHAIEHGLGRTLFDFVAIQYMAKQLYPETFADLDPEKAFRDYHQKYLPVTFSGTWFLSLNP